MLPEWFRLVLGLLIIMFHRQIADWILVREQEIATLLSRRGWDVPTFPTPQSAHTLYFCFGAFVCVFALLRIWILL